MSESRSRSGGGQSAAPAASLANATAFPSPRARRSRPRDRPVRVPTPARDVEPVADGRRDPRRRQKQYPERNADNRVRPRRDPVALRLVPVDSIDATVRRRPVAAVPDEQGRQKRHRLDRCERPGAARSRRALPRVRSRTSACRSAASRSASGSERSVVDDDEPRAAVAVGDGNVGGVGADDRHFGSVDADLVRERRHAVGDEVGGRLSTRPPGAGRSGGRPRSDRGARSRRVRRRRRR